MIRNHHGLHHALCLPRAIFSSELPVFAEKALRLVTNPTFTLSPQYADCLYDDQGLKSRILSVTSLMQQPEGA
jgi:hypothetical protein